MLSPDDQIDEGSHSSEPLIMRSKLDSLLPIMSDKQKTAFEILSRLLTAATLFGAVFGAGIWLAPVRSIPAEMESLEDKVHEMSRVSQSIKISLSKQEIRIERNEREIEKIRADRRP